MAVAWTATKTPKKRRTVRFAEDVIEHVRVEQSADGGVVMKVAFRRPTWLFWVLGFAIILGSTGWYLLVAQASRAATDQRPEAIVKLAAVRSWATLVTAVFGIIFVFPPRSSDWAFARDPRNIARLLFLAALGCFAQILLCAALAKQLTVAPLLIACLLPITFVVGARFGLSLCGLSSATTTWYDKLSGTVALIGALVIPVHYRYDDTSAVAFALAAAAGCCCGFSSWQSKTIRPYFSHGVVVVATSALLAILFSVSLADPAVRSTRIPAKSANGTDKPTAAPPTNETTTTVAPGDGGGPRYGEHMVMINMDSDSFALALLSGICEGIAMYAQALVGGFIDVPAKAAFGVLSAPLLMLFFLGRDLANVGLGISCAVGGVMTVLLAVQLYFGEGHRRETHLHISQSVVSGRGNNDNNNKVATVPDHSPHA